jgi:hypothetical protein
VKLGRFSGRQVLSGAGSACINDPAPSTLHDPIPSPGNFAWAKFSRFDNLMFHILGIDHPWGKNFALQNFPPVLCRFNSDFITWYFVSCSGSVFNTPCIRAPLFLFSVRVKEIVFDTV